MNKRDRYQTNVWHIYQVMFYTSPVGMYDRKGMIALLKYLMSAYPGKIKVLYYGAMPRILKHAGVEIPGLDAVTVHKMPAVEMRLAMTIINEEKNMRLEVFYWDLNRTLVNL